MGINMGLTLIFEYINRHLMGDVDYITPPAITFRYFSGIQFSLDGHRIFFFGGFCQFHLGWQRSLGQFYFILFSI